VLLEVAVGVVVYHAVLQLFEVLRLDTEELPELAEPELLEPPPPPQEIVKIDIKIKNPINLIFIHTP
jgi:hypothetical protein